MPSMLEAINQQCDAIRAWLDGHEAGQELPLYSSVDIRDAGFKRCVVDTNLFPAGFNNLCEHGIADAVKAFRTTILERIAGCRNILVIAEEHTRNAWYLEHLRILQRIIEQAGFHTTVATFLEVQPGACERVNSVELTTAGGHRMTIHAIQRVLRDITAGGVHPCFIILNNDLSTGVPEVLKHASAPIYPSIQAGWHARLKSHHFHHTAQIIREFAELIGRDPWLFSCYDHVLDGVNIHEAADRQRAADAAADLMRRVQAKYDEHGIADKPFVFLKPDRGTYGMGVTAFEEPGQILTLNRRRRNDLYMGKGSQVNTRYLLQEGVPSSRQIDAQPTDICVYQVANQFVGGFYRLHPTKTARENLNAPGMDFQKMCPHSHRYGERVVPPEGSIFDVYRILARIAGIAAHREIQHLEAAVRP